MKHYEMLCVLPGTLAEAEVAPVVESVSQALGSYDATNVTVEDMGKSKLAYPIKHIRYGYFQLFRFELEEKNVAKLENSIRLLGTLLRIIVRVSDPAHATQYTLAQDPTALSAPPKEDPRDSRGKRGARKDEKLKSGEKKSEEKEDRSSVKTSDNTSEKEAIQEKQDEVVEVKEETPVKEKVEESKKVEKKEKKEKKISIEDIDQKLDELLQKDIDTV